MNQTKLGGTELVLVENTDNKFATLENDSRLLAVLSTPRLLRNLGLSSHTEGRFTASEVLQHCRDLHAKRRRGSK